MSNSLRMHVVESIEHLLDDVEALGLGQFSASGHQDFLQFAAVNSATSWDGRASETKHHHPHRSVRARFCSAAFSHNALLFYTSHHIVWILFLSSQSERWRSAANNQIVQFKDEDKVLRLLERLVQPDDVGVAQRGKHGRLAPLVARALAPPPHQLGCECAPRAPLHRHSHHCWLATKIKLTY